jgi:hypothetical protein|nr:MAG TPA: hypothetical protein [Caudoviricetes sp.]
MLIQIIAGVFGHNANGRVIPIRPGEVVEVEEAIGRRLVAKKVAVEVELDEEQSAIINNAEKPEDAPVLDPAAAEFPAYNGEMTRPQLEAIGREIGLDPEELKDAKNKAAVIAMLDEAKAEFEAEEDAPVLDPAAAIK